MLHSEVLDSDGVLDTGWRRGDELKLQYSAHSPRLNKRVWILSIFACNTEKRVRAMLTMEQR